MIGAYHPFSPTLQIMYEKSYKSATIRDFLELHEHNNQTEFVPDRWIVSFEVDKSGNVRDCNELAAAFSIEDEKFVHKDINFGSIGRVFKASICNNYGQEIECMVQIHGGAGLGFRVVGMLLDLSDLDQEFHGSNDREDIDTWTTTTLGEQEIPSEHDSVLNMVPSDEEPAEYFAQFPENSDASSWGGSNGDSDSSQSISEHTDLSELNKEAKNFCDEGSSVSSYETIYEDAFSVSSGPVVPTKRPRKHPRPQKHAAKKRTAASRKCFQTSNFRANGTF